jgi:alkanesulfonate monooxygenase SsuD/methylene tetrahydromethanopterin reductase-like flavin-dependent oxidoreductase (luciferase family)
MKLGLQIVRFDWPGSPATIRPQLAEIAGAAEAAGFSSLWVMDHFFQIQWVGPFDSPMLEAYTTLGFLAAVTQQIALGVLVTGIVYRHPGILIKTATTLDVLSGGVILRPRRRLVGRGARPGRPVPPLPVRYQQLEETLQVLRQVWSGETGAYHGAQLEMAEPVVRPAPLSRPHPSILIGGGGEKKTLRLVAQYADACNLFAGRDIRHKLDVLHRHCDDVGRDYATIERTALGQLRRGRQAVPDLITSCRSMARAGIQHYIVSLMDPLDVGLLDTIGREVVPAIAEL